ncbi:MAG: PQQ-binding-like beta-propeller repeat protein [Candidatus Fermentibacteria bacterium]
MKLNNSYIGIVIPILISSAASYAQTIDWNVPIGGNVSRNGISQYYGPLVATGGQPELYWSGGEYAKYAGHPVIEGDKLLVYRRWSSASQTESWIVCYNVYTGTELWKVTLPVDPQSDHYGKVSGVNNGQVYATRAGGHTSPSSLYALDIETGTVLWQSEGDVTEYRSETVTFAENGNIIAGNVDEILCINKDDGTTAWSLDRHCWDDAGASVSAYGDRGYYWDRAAGTLDLVISVCDLETGNYLYSTDAITTGGIQAQQAPITIGPDGTVYSTRSNSIPDFDYITSFTDTGTGFIWNWEYPTAWVTFGNHGAAPDGTVYTYSRTNEIVRLDPTDGTVLNTSIPISTGYSVSPAIAFGADGYVYFTSEDYPTFQLYFFTPELELLWTEVINGIRGVAVGDSVVAVCGKGTEIRAYRGRSGTGIAETNIGSIPSCISLTASPSPSSDQTILTFELAEATDVKLDIFDVAGRLVRRFDLGQMQPQEHSVIWNGQDQSGLPVADGIYMVRLTGGGITFANTRVVCIR